VLIVAEYHRIYAITLKNRIITACCCVMTVAQFGLGVYSTSVMGTGGGELFARRSLQFVSTLILQLNRCRGSHLMPIRCAPSRRVDLRPCSCRSDLPRYLWHMVRNPSCRSSGRHSPRCVPRRSHLLNHRVYRIAIEPTPVPDTQSAHDHSTGCDTLFSGHIHFAAFARVDLDTDKGRYIIVYPRPLFLTC